MKNKFRIGEIVVVNGKGKIYDKHFKALGIIQYKDYYFNEYFVTMISSNKEDWFSEEDIEIVMDRKYKKTDKYKVVMAINIKGLQLILNKIEKMPNKNNNILKKLDLYKEYKVFRNTYAILVWTSTYWYENNFVVKCIQDSFKTLRENNFAYKQIIIGETNPKYIKINEFIDNDQNVDIFNINQKIELKNIGGILV